MVTHGHSPKHAQSPTYRCWAVMMQRCQNPNFGKFPRYGGRGIRVCEEWRSFGKFLEDMGVKPDGMTIGRINNDGNYEKSNCRWETVEEQANNRSNNHFLTADGRTLTIAQWAKELNIKQRTLAQRLYRGWDIQRALKEPLRV